MTPGCFNARLLLLMIVGGICAASAGSFTVSTTSDAGPGSLRQAILDANAVPEADTISCAVTGVIVLASALPSISDDLTITGPGTNLLTISGNNSVQIFSVSAGTNSATISGLTIANGRATGYANGAGIANAGTLTISECALVGNKTLGGWGGAVFNSGNLTVNNSAFFGNQVTGEAGAGLNGNVLNAGGGGAGMGGGLFNLSGTLSISGCALINNSATGGNGGGGSTVGNGRGGGINGGPGKQEGNWSSNGANGGFGGGGGGSGALGQTIGGAGGFGGGGGGSSEGMSAGQAGFGGGAGGVVIDWNCCASAGGGGAGLGGGIFVKSGTVWIGGDCTFAGNQAIGGSGGGNTQGHGSNGSGIGPDFFNMAGDIQPALTATALGGGTVTVNPTNPPYLNNSLATVTAAPASGWKLLNWLGDASGTNQTIDLTISRNKHVEAVFGTGLTISALISSSPQADYFPYGTTVKLTALPPAGTFFASWSGAANGSANPLNHDVTIANQTISCLFSPLNAGQFALAVIENGRGFVSASPAGNFHTNGQLVTLTPTPDAGQDFNGWSGDASGTNTPLVVTMNQSKTITANFTKRPSLRVGTPLEGLVEDGFRLSLLGEFGTPYAILGSTNLHDWQVAGAVTNTYGTVQFVDPDGTNMPKRYYRATEP